MPRLLTVTLALVALTGAVLIDAVAVSSASAGTVAASPQIVAHPDSVMVNGTTRLTGRHFKKSTTFVVEECSEQNWIAPQNPCDSSSAITVTTNGRGQFSGVLTVHTCPAPATPGFSQTCYVGEPVGTGVDTVALLGVTAITVTGP